MVFAPLAFVENLRYLWLGMGVIFGVMGMLVLATMLLRRLTANN